MDAWLVTAAARDRTAETAPSAASCWQQNLAFLLEPRGATRGHGGHWALEVVECDPSSTKEVISNRQNYSMLPQNIPKTIEN